jgi:DNA anti-recombination protein RmuC
VNDNFKSLGGKVDKVEETLTKLKNDVQDIETAVEDQGRRITEIEMLKKERVDPQDKTILELETRLKEVKDYMTYQENR